MFIDMEKIGVLNKSLIRYLGNIYDNNPKWENISIEIVAKILTMKINYYIFSGYTFVQLWFEYKNKKTIKTEKIYGYAIKYREDNPDKILGIKVAIERSLNNVKPEYFVQYPILMSVFSGFIKANDCFNFVYGKQGIFKIKKYLFGLVRRYFSDKVKKNI